MNHPLHTTAHDLVAMFIVAAIVIAGVLWLKNTGTPNPPPAPSLDVAPFGGGRVNKPGRGA